MANVLHTVTMQDTIKKFQLEFKFQVILLLIGFLDFNEVRAAESLRMSTDPIGNFSNFLTIHGKGLMPNQTYDVVEVLRKCECRHLCLVNPKCIAFSIRSILYDRLLCSLADDDVYTNTPHEVSNSTYYMRPHPQDVLGPDNLFYRRLDTAVNDFDGSKQACQNVPGFRLVAIRFMAQMPVLLRMCLGRKPVSETECNSEWFYVDMVKVNGIPMIQGKIPVNETDLRYEEDLSVNDEDKDLFIYAHSAKIHDEIISNTKPVCQANAFDVPW